MRQRRWLELISDYDCEIMYHSGKANVVADSLSCKTYKKTIRGISMRIDIISSLIKRIK